MNAKKSTEFKNPYEDVTIDDIRSIPRFQNCTDEQAQAIIYLLKEFTEIVYQCYQLDLFAIWNDPDTTVIEFNPDHYSKAA